MSRIGEGKHHYLYYKYILTDIVGDCIVLDSAFLGILHAGLRALQSKRK